MAEPLRGGRGSRAGSLRKKILEPFFRRSNILTAIKLEVGGGVGLNSRGRAIKRRTFFCGFPKGHVKLHFCDQSDPNNAQNCRV